MKEINTSIILTKFLLVFFTYIPISKALEQDDLNDVEAIWMALDGLKEWNFRMIWMALMDEKNASCEKA